MVERLNGIEKVRGSTPLISTRKTEVYASVFLFQAVVARYTNADGSKKAGWMKAPNGRATRLTERQWVQVRTPAFKKWFGDWESVAERKAMQARIAEWHSPEILEEAKGLTREQIFAKYGNELQPVSVIPKQYVQFLDPSITDNRVYSGKGYMIDHAVNHHDESDPAAYLNIQDVIDSPDDVLLDDRNPARNKSLVFVKKVDKVGVVIVSFDQGKDGKILLHKSFFDHFKENRFKNYKSVKLSSVVGNPTISHAEESAPAVRLSALEDKGNISNFVGESNPASVSKVVDENGEPLVVYHRTDWNPLAGEKGKAVFNTDGAYFTSVLDESGYYGKNVVEAFLNIRNPCLYDIESDEPISAHQLDDYQELTDLSARELAQRGFDGAMTLGVKEANEHWFFANDSTQIKSATDSTGAFNPQNADIRYSLVTPEESVSNDGDIKSVESQAMADFAPDAVERTSDGETIVEADADRTHARFSMRTWEEGGRDILMKYLDREDEVDGLSKKDRRAFDRVLREIIKRGNIDKLRLDEADFVEINRMIREAGKSKSHHSSPDWRKRRNGCAGRSSTRVSTR